VNTPSQDRSQAEQHILHLTGSKDTPVAFQTFHDSIDDHPGARHLHGTLDMAWDTLIAQNNQGFGVYIMVNEGDGLGRSGKNVTTLRALFIDEDGKDFARADKPPKASGDIVAYPGPRFAPAIPSLTIESSPGLQHNYFQLVPGEGGTTPEARKLAFKTAQQTLAAHFNTDPQPCDLPRVMRLAGFLHMKRPEAPTLVTVVQANEARYTITQVLDAYRTGASLRPADLKGTAVVESAPSPARPLNISDLRETLKKTKARKPEHKEWMTAVLEGAPLSGEGGRNQTMWKAASYLAFTLPDTETDAFLALLRPSLYAMAAEEGNDIEEWVEEMEEKLERARGEQRQQAEDARRFKEDSKVLSRLASVDPGESAEPYTQEEVAGWAKAAGCTLEEFQRRWIIQYAGAYFFLRNGRYDYPLPEKAAANDMHVALSRADGFVDLTVPTKTGEKKKSLSTVIQEYGTVVPRLAFSYLHAGSYYDKADKTLLLGAAPLRKIEPRFNANIQRWLELLGANDPERFFDWLATLTDLSKPTCALYLRGPRGIGKNMFYLGLSRLWTKTGPVMLTVKHFTDWNDDYLSCPLLVVDEAMPGAKDDKSLDGYMRQLITAESRPLAQKFLIGRPPLLGAQRVVMVANKDDLLAFSEDMTGEALDATAERYFYLRCDEEPGKFIESLGGRKATESWVAGDEIAAHIHHLAQSRKVKPYGRLLVSGKLSQMRSKLAASSGIAPHVCEYILKTLKDPKYRDQFLRVGNGRILVSALTIVDKARWEGMVPAARVPSLQRAAEALKAISVSEQQVRVWEKGVRKRYYELDLEILKDKAEELQMFDRSEIDEMTARYIAEEAA
jgi:hypothetical protein